MYCNSRISIETSQDIETLNKNKPLSVKIYQFLPTFIYVSQSLSPLTETRYRHKKIHQNGSVLSGSPVSTDS